MNAKKFDVKKFFNEDIWRFDLSELSVLKSFLVKEARILTLSIQGFIADNCSLRASALTFYSIFSLVPVAAMIFGIAKGFGYEEHLKNDLMERFSDHQAILERVFDFADSMLLSVRGGMLAGVGLLILFWTVIKVIGNIEHSFNHIWGVKQSRSLWRKFSDYISMLLVLFLLLIVVGGVSVFVNTALTRVSEFLPWLDLTDNRFSTFAIKMIPFVLAWGLFTFVYKVMPNTRVMFRSALLGGVIAGTAFQFLQMIYILLQVVIFSKYNTIYGSFAVLPLFLIWLQFSWLLVLFGAEISFAHQNIETSEFEPHALEASYYLRKQLLLQVAALIVKTFVRQEEPLTDSNIGHVCGIPVRLVRDILYTLVSAGIIRKVVSEHDGDTVCYQPAVPVDKLTIQYVLNASENSGRRVFPVPDTDDFRKISSCLAEIDEKIENAPENKLLKDI